MGKMASMCSQAVIDGLRGKVDFYVYKGVPCFRMWPRSPGKKRTPAVMAGWVPFTSATRLWNDLSPYVREQYIKMAGTSGLSGRDMFMRSYLKGLYRAPTP